MYQQTMRPEADEFVPSFKPTVQASVRAMFIPAAPPVNVPAASVINFAPSPVAQAINPNYVLPPRNSHSFLSPVQSPSPTLTHQTQACSFTPPPPPTPPPPAVVMSAPATNSAWFDPGSFSVDLDKLKISTTNLASTFGTLQEENQTLKTELSDIRGSYALKLALAEHNLETEKTSSAQLKADLELTKKEKANLLAHYEALRASKVESTFTLVDREKDVAQLREQIGSLEEERKEFTTTLADRDEEVARLKAKIEDMEKERNELNGLFEVMQAKFLNFIAAHQKEMEKKKILEERLLE